MALTRALMLLLVLLAGVGCECYALPTPSPSPEPPRSPHPFEVLFRTDSGHCQRHTTPFLVALTDPADALSVAYMLESLEQTQLAAVDRRRDLLILVSHGQQGSTAHGVRVRSVEVAGGAIAVHAELIRPPRGVATNPAMTCPRDLIRIPKPAAHTMATTLRLIVNGEQIDAAGPYADLTLAPDDSPREAPDDLLAVRFVFARRESARSRQDAAEMMRRLAIEVRSRGYRASLDTSRCADIPAVVAQMPPLVADAVERHLGRYAARSVQSAPGAAFPDDPPDACLRPGTG